MNTIEHEQIEHVAAVTLTDLGYRRIKHGEILHAGKTGYGGESNPHSVCARTYVNGLRFWLSAHCRQLASL